MTPSDTPQDRREAVREFLATLKIHNKDLDACFNDAVAVAHLERLIDAECLAVLDLLQAQAVDKGTDHKWLYVPVSAIEAIRSELTKDKTHD